MKTDQPKMIQSDGSIVANIPGAEATWFLFLTISRALNSKQGGWNSKTHWATVGLDQLMPRGSAAIFLSKWTESSLKDQAKPKPRSNEFMLEHRLSALKEGIRGGALIPKKNSENRLSWDLSRWIQKEHTCPEPGRQRVATYELPLAAEKEGQLKADVVLFDETGFVEIVELKKSGALGNPDSPLMALVEAICYALQLLRSWSDLRSALEKVAPGRWPELKAIRTISLVLAAPDYWDTCKPGKKGSAKSSIAEKEITCLRSIVTVVEAGIRKHLGLRDLKLTLTLADVLENGTLGMKAIPINSSPPPERSILWMSKP